jgi:hypothetical protein
MFTVGVFETETFTGGSDEWAVLAPAGEAARAATAPKPPPTMMRAAATSPVIPERAKLVVARRVTLRRLVAFAPSLAIISSSLPQPFLVLAVVGCPL